jgi:hypothetical protein
MILKHLIGWILIYGVFCGMGLIIAQTKNHMKQRDKIAVGIILGTMCFVALTSLYYLMSVIPWNYKVW